MKVVLFCGGLGTRIREYSEAVPKPMIPIGHQPILWHVMNYYSEYGHKDFVLCLGYKANTVKDFFLNNKQQSYADVVVEGAKVEMLGPREEDWRVAMIDTGVWRNIGSRLWAVREHVKNEEVFLANYSDGLSDVNLDDMIAKFKASEAVACFLAVHPPVTYHIADIAADGRVREFITSDNSEIWINGGFFLLKPAIFDYMNDGEELVVEPFARLIKENKLMAYKHEGFWRSMDTLRDRQVLEDMIEKGDMPWRVSGDKKPCEMRPLDLVSAGKKLSVLCLGAHADDIEIGAGGALLTWIASGAELDIHWCVATGVGDRANEARASAQDFLTGAAKSTIEVGGFRDSYLPYEGAKVKEWVEAQKPRMKPDIVLTHCANDAHQDHRLINELAWNAFRDSIILEYEIPKWDGDLGRPNAYVAIEEATLAKKIALLEKHFATQRSKDWFDAETFRGLARLRGVECRARYAEAFYVRKLVIA